jgi:hypothetical protein
MERAGTAIVAAFFSAAAAKVNRRADRNSFT